MPTEATSLPIRPAEYARTLREEMVARCDLFGCRLPRRRATGKSPVKEHRTAYGVSSADGAPGCPVLRPLGPESDGSGDRRGPAGEAGRVSVRYVVGFAYDNTEEVADRGEAGRLQRRGGHWGTAGSGQLPGGSGAGDHRGMVAEVEGAARGGVDAHVRHESGQDQVAAGCFAEPGVQVGADERVGVVLDDDGLAGKRATSSLIWPISACTS